MRVGKFMKNKEGFTLIELLAIIVILAIIAVITVPIILNIIDNSRKGAVGDSALGYKDAMQKYYLTKSVSDTSFEGPTGTYSISDLPSDFEVSGEEPTEGWVELEKGKVVNYSLRFNDYVVTYNAGSGIIEIVKNGELAMSPYLALVSRLMDSLSGVEKSDGAIYLNDAVDIYFDPTTYMLCNSTNSVSTPGTVSGCMHWYLYSAKGDYVNMLLDHNISEVNSMDGVWASFDDYSAGLISLSGYYGVEEGEDSKAISAGVSYPSSITSFPLYGTQSDQSLNSRGPLTVLNYLKANTLSWKTGTPKIPNASNENEYIVSSDLNDNKYQIDYSGYHARILTRAEAENLNCNSNEKSCPDWMVSKTMREDPSVYSNIRGYWLSDVISDNSRSVSHLYYARKVSSDFASERTNGVRPVITVPIVDIADALSN